MKDVTLGIKSLIRQQQILTHLGFYNGKIDGRWGPKTIEAKKEYERDPRYKPAVPTYGLPISSKPPYPTGLYMGSDGLLLIKNVAVEDLPAVHNIGKEAIMPKQAKPLPKPFPFVEMEGTDLTPVTEPTVHHRETIKDIDDLVIKSDIL
jgi:hypothetical protein